MKLSTSPRPTWCAEGYASRRIEQGRMTERAEVQAQLHDGDGNPRFQNRGLSARLTMIRYDQTVVWETPRITCSEEVGQSLQGRVCFLLRVRLQHGNSLDCPIGTFSARRRGMGIFEVAPLTRLPDKYGQTLLYPVCRISEE